MKSSLINKKYVVVLFALTVSASLAAQDGSTKEINKEFPVTQNTRLEIFNKHGNVDVINHDDASVTIQVQIKIDSRAQQRNKEILDMITIDIQQQGDVIKAITNIDENFSKVFRGFNSGDNGLQINYTITMPKTLPIYLSNKYGNVFIDELFSTSTIDVKYGRLTANKIIHDSRKPLTKIYLSYSNNSSIQETKWIEADIKYSKLNITESKALAIISKYSKVYVTNGSSIVSESKYDTYEVERLTNFVATAGYSHFKFGKLTGKLQVETKYSDVIVDYIAPTFEGIKINNSYGSYRLGIDPSASYRINGYSKYCSIIYPESNARVNRFNENNEMKVNGIIGTNQAPKAEVSVVSHYGNIKLTE